jgi:hypothetical protein
MGTAVLGPSRGRLEAAVALPAPRAPGRGPKKGQETARNLRSPTREGAGAGANGGPHFWSPAPRVVGASADSAAAAAPARHPALPLYPLIATVSAVPVLLDGQAVGGDVGAIAEVIDACLPQALQCTANVETVLYLRSS